MTIDMSQFYEVFFDEAEELLAEAEHLLLGISVDDPDTEDLNAIFRVAHSIKGGAATFGFMDMTEITHVLESLLDRIRKNAMALTAEHVDAFLAAKDVLKMELDGYRLATAVDQEQIADVKMMLKSLSGVAAASISPAPVMTSPVMTSPVATTIDASADKAVSALAVTVTVDNMKNFNIVLPEMSEKEVINLQEELSLLGKVISTKQATGRYIFCLNSDSSQADIISICSFVLDPDDLVITIAATEPAVSTSELAADTALEWLEQPSNSNAKPESEVEIEQEAGSGIFSMPDGESVEEGYGFFAPFTAHKDSVATHMLGDDTARSPEVIVAQETGLTNLRQPAATMNLVEDRDKKHALNHAVDKPQTNAESSSIRVGIEKVDQLINLVGELVITQAMIEQRVSKLDPITHEDLVNSISQLTRNTRDLQESVMSIRMMPIDFVFSRFPRVVRDLATRLGKKVELVTKGAHTELDKGLIERIVDPLTHLIRNSIDHGIEIPEKRKASNKDEVGRLTLSATHKGGCIVIEVSDDGAGLNREKLLCKAKSSGLTAHENMPDSEVFGLIFAPGLSTAEVVTDISGRGVGMDVVKRNITAMSGTIEIRSALGLGTTFSIYLPLTLAILDGMSVSLGNSVYIIPLNLIVETLQPRSEDIKTITGEGRIVHVRGEYLPVIALHSLFNHATDITDPSQGVLVLLEADGKKSALLVDRLVGQQQVVIKSLETNYRKIPGVSAATIMGDGSVALILDVPAIIQMGQSHNYLTGSLTFSNSRKQSINMELTQ